MPFTKRLILISALSAAWPSAAALAKAPEVAATSSPTQVMVFPSGAEVTRTARVSLPAGEHTVVLKDLPAEAVAGSIRIEGRSTGRLEIGSVESRRIGVPRTDPVASESERQRLEIAIEKLRDERALIEADIKAAELQKTLMARLADLPSRPPAAGQPAGATDWGAIFSLIGSRTAEAEKAVLAAGLRLRAVDRRIEDVEKALGGLAPAIDQRTEVRIHAVAAAPLEATLVVRYQVSSASWTPLYDARLTTGARNVAPSLTIARRAAITQRTGEDWSNVSVSLSTNRPAASADAPVLTSIAVDFAPDAPPRPQPAPGLARRSPGEGNVPAVLDTAPAAAPAPTMAIEERAAEVQVAPFQALYQLPGRLTVPATGDPARVQIDAAQVEPTLTVRAVPRLQRQGYLYARIIVPRTSSAYLPGVVSLFRDGIFVGNGNLPQLAPGQEHEVGFGPDDAVQVRHAIVEDKRGESGLISTSRTDSRSYRITIKNLHERPIAVAVLDQMPVSRQQEIKVELTGRTPPTRRDVEERRGVLAWEASLQPNEEKVIEFGYRISWPAAKRLIYGR